jgi:hypothetical protein
MVGMEPEFAAKTIRALRGLTDKPINVNFFCHIQAKTATEGTLTLVPQVVDAVKVPVVAAGGIADGRGIAAAFALGAAGTQLGTGYLLCPEAATSELHRDALRHAHSDATFVTNVFTGRPARALSNRLALEIGPILDALPKFTMRPLLERHHICNLFRSTGRLGAATYTMMRARKVSSRTIGVRRTWRVIKSPFPQPLPSECEPLPR